MTQTKKYAIRCSSEEEAREIVNKGFQPCSDKHEKYFIDDYTIISYKEAVEMGLLGKYDTNKLSDEKYDTNTLPEMVEPSNDELIEKIVVELRGIRHYEKNVIDIYTRNILTKHLSSK